MHLFNLLTENTSLKWLWVPNNNITDEVCELIRLALKKSNFAGHEYIWQSSKPQRLVKNSSVKDNDTLQVLRLQ